MSLKTCKILQTIAVCLFALAFLIVLLSVPMKNMFINLAYPNYNILLSGNTSDSLRASVFPTINFIAALVYLGISLVHFYVLKKPDKKYILISVIVCSIAFFIYKVLSPALNNHFTSKAFARGEADGNAYYNVYAMLENALYGITTFLAVPASILMFLSFGGSIGKGAEEKAEAAAVLPEAQQKPEAAEASKPEEPKPAAKKRIELPGLEEPAIDPETYQKAFQRPSADAQQEASEADEPASDDPNSYAKAFQRPKSGK